MPEARAAGTIPSNATTIIINSGKARYAWTTLVPLSFVGTTTLVAGYQSVTGIFWPLTRHAETATQGYVNTALTVTLMPGFMRTERVEATVTTEAIKQQFRYDLSESTEYIGRAVAALAGDPKVLRKSGRIHFVADIVQWIGSQEQTDHLPWPRYLYEPQVPKGAHYGASHALEVEWAEIIQQMIPSAARVRFTISGTEATHLALRLCR